MLTAADHRHMKEKGYLVIPNAVPPEDLAAVVDGIWSHMRMDRNNPDSWYEDPNADKLQKYGFMRQMHTQRCGACARAPEFTGSSRICGERRTCGLTSTAASSSHRSGSTGRSGE